MELQQPILPQASCATLEELISAVNVFAVKRWTKKGKKFVLTWYEQGELTCGFL